MAMTLIGDMSRHFQSLRSGTALRQQLDRLTAETASGVARDAAAHLAGRADRLVQADRQIALRSSEHAATLALGRRMETAQTALAEVADRRRAAATGLVALSPDASASQIGNAAAGAEAAFRAVVSALNTRHGSESLFAGTESDGAALAGADTILAALRTQTAGAVSAADLAARVDSFFSDPGGGFMTQAYLGDSGPPLTRRIGDDRQVTAGPRADDPALRDVLRGLALAAVAADPSLALDGSARAATLRQAGVDLVAGAEPLTGIQGALGAAQEQVDAAAAAQSARLTAARILRNDLVAVDPAETASRLTQVQTQLETHYTVTARLSGLTLAGYLR